MNFLQVHHEGNSNAPQRCKSFAYDVNQQAESLVRWEQRYDQHSRGAFYGYLDELKLGGLHLFEEFTSRRLFQKCCVNEDSVWLGFSLQDQRPKINGNEIEQGQLMVRPSGVEFELLTPPDFHIFGLVLEKNTIADELQGLDKELWLRNCSNWLVTRPDGYVSYELAKTISLMLDDNSPLTEGLSRQDKSIRIERLRPIVASRIADLLMRVERGMQEVNISRPEKRLVLDRVRQHIQETGRYPLTVSELCSIAYVSRRTLQYCFEHELGVSPIQYLRDCRLNEIRRLLIESQEPLVIADLAMEYGFYHISTFNEHYKQLFGETPTQTMLRASKYSHVAIALKKSPVKIR
ncbi:helix-turn-helix domain-containing protein [Vibrio salinus]|uniref:helix-turn-helix domain-containing protein n=1 Tax=Vibrio salinus TaxID=2899784 RepID=UPI001E3102A3|nr:helix-turn-helix domain-containing protein [Vibrio salinus]MCE0495598.1 helix-turn-helix domain-containing protein [Vibrio salinus]